MKNEEFINLIKESVSEVLNEMRVSQCNDCDRPGCKICNPNGAKKITKGYVAPSLFNRIMNCARKGGADPHEIQRALNMLRLLQQKANERRGNIKENLPSKSLSEKIKTALGKYPSANEIQVNSYVKSHAKNKPTLGDLESDAKAQKWNVDTVRAIYYVLSRP